MDFHGVYIERDNTLSQLSYNLKISQSLCNIINICYKQDHHLGICNVMITFGSSLSILDFSYIN